MLELAQRAAGKIRREKRPWSDPLAALLQAAINSADGDDAGCRDLLRTAASGFDAAQMKLYAAATRRRLGVMTGNRPMVEEVDAWMRQRGIVRPSRMTTVLAPGFVAD